MKKILLGLALSLLLCGSVSAAEFNVNLKYGSKGTEVKKLQEFLTEQDVYSGPITGNFFSLTLKAVKAFQLRESITPVSGFFGALTRAKVNELLDSQLADSEVESVSDPVIVEPAPVSAEVLRLNEILGAVQSQNQILQGSLDVQRAEADRLRAAADAEAARLRAIADAADAAALARQQIEQAARDLAAQQAAVEASKPLFTPEQLKAKYLNYSDGGPHLLLRVTSKLDIIDTPGVPALITVRVNFSRNGSYETWGDAKVVFNGQTVLTRDRDGYVSGLESGKRYYYQIVYPSPGREDSVYEGEVPGPTR